jgi:hypothetical protein
MAYPSGMALTGSRAGEWSFRPWQIAQNGLQDLATQASRVGTLLGLLLATDVAFAILHILHTLAPVEKSPLYSLGRDTSFPEMWQYTQWFWLATLLAALGLRRRQWHYATWAMLVVYALADDAFTLHERAGVALAQALALPALAGLRAIDLGELLFLAGMAALLFPPVVFAYRRGDASFRRFSAGFGAAFALAALFAVGVDALHAVVSLGKIVNGIFMLIEEIGEMVAVSLALAFVFAETSVSNRRPS